MFPIKKWKLSAIFLFLLTAFSVEKYPGFHDFLALAFFLANIRPMLAVHHYRFLGWAYLSALPVFFWSFLWGEVAAICVLCLYHAAILIEAKRLNSRRATIHKTLGL
jgi:hypothetical protein